ncbi:MAG: lipoprotein-releasing ABC transporter permease subunit LolC [Plesiomonas sp.]|uniref:lipoprotein-releasing ABC transporter permease subunit LolC n=1 Tax=Plesiomonas sp. TaxID=2486279 RepID=UPI003F324A83
MFTPASIFIGLRYLRGRTGDRFGRFVSRLSTMGITLGVLALIIVLSVMNGFERDLKDNTLNLMPQVLITSEQGSINPDTVPFSQLAMIPDVVNHTPLVMGDVIIQSAQNIGAGVMLGIDPKEGDPLSAFLIDSSLDSLKASEYHVILGDTLAGQLGVMLGDKVRLMVTSASQFTPMGRIPSQRLFTVSGIFSAGSDVDASQILVNIQDAARLMRLPNSDISGWRLFLKDPLDVAQVAKTPLPDHLIWEDWRARKGELFQAVKMEKNMMGLLLSLIITVAAFNIITSLSLMVMEKQGEVAILQTLGLNARQVMIIFITQGASAGVVGALCGGALGALIATNLNSILSLLGIELLQSSSLPVVVEPLQIITIILFAIIVALLSTLYPAWRASAVKPAEALRYE